MSPPSPSAAASRPTLGLITLLGLLTAIAPWSIDLYLPSLPTMAPDLHASDGQVQATVSTFLAGMAIGQLFYGPASDRFGRRAPILLSLVIFTLASIACALATSADAMLAARFVQGIGGCGGAVVARAVVRDRFDHTETARTLSLMMLVMGVAPILAPLIGGGLLLLGGWRLNFWVLVAYGALLLAAAFLRLGETRSAEAAAHARTEHPLQAYLALARHPRLVGYALAGALNGAILFTYISSSPSLLIGMYGVSPQQFGLVFGTNAFGLIMSGQINRVLLRRSTPEILLARASGFVALLGLTMAAVSFAGFQGPFVILPMLFLLLASYGLISTNSMAGALNVDPRRSGAISAFVGTGTYVVGALASAGAGMLHDGTTRPMALIIAISAVGSWLAVTRLALREPVAA